MVPQYRLYEKTAKLKSKLGEAVTFEKKKIYIEKIKATFCKTNVQSMQIDRFALLENVFLYELVRLQVRINHTLLLTTPSQISHYTYALSLSFLQKMNKLMTSSSLVTT